MLRSFENQNAVRISVDRHVLPDLDAAARDVYTPIDDTVRLVSYEIT